LLEVPALDLTWSHPSHDEFGSGYGLTTWDLELARNAYLNSLEDATEPYVSPLHAADLSDLPPAHIMAAEYDPLRDEAAAYAERLTEAGVPATYSMQPGHVHISPAMTKVMASARAWRDEVISVLRAQSASR
jgi:acetyl esterase